MKEVLVPGPGRPELDLGSIVSQGKVVLLDVADAENAAELLPAALLAKSCFARMILSRRRTDVNQTRPVFALFEEYQRVMTPQPDSPACEANWMDTCRWCGCGVVLCTQSLSALHAKAPGAVVDQIVSLCSAKVFLASTDPATQAWAARSLPGKWTHRVQRTVTKISPPPLLFPRDYHENESERRVLVPFRESPSLEGLKPGTMLLRQRNGTVQRIETDLGAP